jgi:hypothetical protein
MRRLWLVLVCVALVPARVARRRRRHGEDRGIVVRVEPPRIAIASSTAAGSGFRRQPRDRHHLNGRRVPPRVAFER